MITLYSYFRSTSAWRVRIALAFKAIDHRLVPVHLLRDGGQQHQPFFADRNPMAQVPVLETSGPEGTFRLSQSMAILEYLDERFPDPALLPAAPEARARAREFAEIINSGIQPLQNLRTQNELRALGIDPQPIVRGFIDRGLTALEHLAQKSAGRFCIGDTVTLADCYLIPQLGFVRRVQIPLDPYPHLCRIEAECEPLPAFQTAHPSAQPDFEPA
jgi:maleylpyruvate isomerase